MAEGMAARHIGTARLDRTGLATLMPTPALSRRVPGLDLLADGLRTESRRDRVFEER